MIYLALQVDNVTVDQFVLDKPTISIGRHPDNDIQIDDIAVSNRHAVIRIKASSYLPGTKEISIEDLGSTNATRVNGQKIEKATTLSHGDMISIAFSLFKLYSEDDSALEKTAIILSE